MLDLPALPVKVFCCVVLRPCRTLLGTEFHRLHLLAKVEETTFWIVMNSALQCYR